MEPVTLKSVLDSITGFLRDLFNLHEDRANEKETIEEIKRTVVFRGANLWILIFAIMVCSVGLDVNSTAVVIGAMLISPLMGPIMGVGLGVGINDLQLIIRALKNLGIAVIMSVLTSALYFWISPLDQAQSELLARTQPTLWDVLIAMFGGLAGIVAGSRREKSNAIPGVAIATALMPPLCTTGFGLATGNWEFFFGAFYLFFINSVFISLATFLIVRFLRFHPKEFLDSQRESQVKRYIAIFVILTIIPSVITAFTVVRKTVFERNASRFVRTEMIFDNCQVINQQYIFGDSSRIVVSLLGEPIENEKIQDLESRMSQYNLDDVKLVIRQGYVDNDNIDLATMEEMSQQMSQQLKIDIIEDLYKENTEILKSKDAEIEVLQGEILRLRSKELPVMDITKEVKVQYPNIREFSITNTLLVEADSLKQDTLYLVYANFKRKPKRTEVKKLTEWLQLRIKADTLKLVVE
jgi:uncharacterized hydrophobic protein (TIGR00271 family)